MRLNELLNEAVDKKLKKGMKIRVLKGRDDNAPTFQDVPTAGATRYHHNFAEGDILRIFSIGPKRIVVDVLTPGTGRYEWKSGNKVTEFKTQNYKWYTDPANFDETETWYERIEEETPDVITTLEAAKEWIKANGSGGLNDMQVDKDGNFTVKFLRLTMRADAKLRMKFSSIGQLNIEKPPENIKDLPDVKIPKNVVTLVLSGGKYVDLKDLPKLEKVEKITLDSNKVLTSISGLMDKCPNLKSFSMHNTPKLKSGLLEIPHLNEFYFGEQDVPEVKKALTIVRAHVGEGLKGVVKAQRELIENDLDDFADD